MKPKHISEVIVYKTIKGLTNDDTYYDFTRNFMYFGHHRRPIRESRLRLLTLTTQLLTLVKIPEPINDRVIQG